MDHATHRTLMAAAAGLVNEYGPGSAAPWEAVVKAATELFPEADSEELATLTEDLDFLVGILPEDVARRTSITN